MIDFETYSEAGYRFDEDAGFFRSITRTHRGLPSVGAPAYAEHPSTEILSLAYDLDDGHGVQLWIPGNRDPIALFNHVRSGCLVSAWNASFEYYIWKHVAHARLGWPALDWMQLRDPMARARAWSLPGKLATCASVLGSDVAQKDSDGTRLLNKFSKPKKPTRADPRLRIRPEDDPPDAYRLYAYNRQDVIAESSVSASLPDLSYTEATLWSLDQSINYRGVQIDRDALADCLAIVNQAEHRYTNELIGLTHGEVKSGGQLKKITAWLASRGVYLETLGEADVEAALARSDLSGLCRRVLELRRILSNASVKKLHAISRRMSKDGRLRDLFIFCGADRTGRWAGAGVQPQNLPAIGLPHGTVDDALRVISQRSLDIVEAVYGDAMTAVSACIRGLFIAAPGHELISSDYSAIEAVCLAALAGERWRLEVFRSHGLIYETSAALVTGVSLAEQAAYREQHGKHHPARKVGKVAELACFSGETKVLTDSGWKRIDTITLDDRIYDGVEFTAHSGVIDHGNRDTINLCGVNVTPDHKFYLCENQWISSADLNRAPQHLNRALDTADWSLRRYLKNHQEGSRPYSACVIVDALQTSPHRILGVEGQHNVIPVQRNHPERVFKSTIGAQCLLKLLNDYAAESRPLMVGVPTSNISNIRYTADEEYSYTKIGCRIAQSGWSTCSRWTVAKTPKTQSIELTMTSDINPETFDSSLTKNNRKTKPRQFGSSIRDKKCVVRSFTGATFRATKGRPQPEIKLNRECLPSKSSHRVYDIINCGRRCRFLIQTNRGCLIAHNSGYQGSIGAWRKFGAAGTDAEILAHVRAWRKSSPSIVAFWYTLERIARDALRYPGRQSEYRGLVFCVTNGCLVIRLLSGRCLNYHGASITVDDRLVFWGYSAIGGWQQTDTYGGKLAENITQATARDIIGHAMPEVTRAGYPIVLHVHDELVSEIPVGFGSVDHYERLMSALPDWCSDWPIRASGGWRDNRYKK